MKNRSLLAAIALALPGVLFPRDARAQTPVINSLSATTLAQAGRLVIQGSNLGARQGNGKVTIGGASAPISSWTDNAITVYVPDASPLSADLVQVTSGRASNALTLNVTARAAAGDHIRWRFQTAGLYIQGRPGVGPDGTVYALDVDGHLYALTPEGGLKWIFNTSATAVQSVDVGPDGTVYIASAGNTIYAVNPTGTLKWQVSDPTGVPVEAGPNVGPDGNIYAVTGDAGLPNGLGAVTISPAGQVLNKRTGYLSGRGEAFTTREIVFGAPSRFYFTLNNIDNNSGLQFFQLGGSFLFARSAGGSDEQPDVDAAGNIYSNIASTQIGVFDVNGNLLRSTFFTGTLSAPNLGADGTIYQAESFPTNLRALNPDLSTKWTLQGSAYFGPGPVVDPTNKVVVAGLQGIGTPSSVEAVDAKTGALLWLTQLPAENGGFVRPMSRARFTPDGTSAYIGMDVNDGAANPYSYLYAFDTSTAGATDTVQITRAQYSSRRSQLTVQATDSDPTAILTVSVTSTGTILGNMTNKGGGNYTAKFTGISNPLNITVTSNLGGSASAPVTGR